MQQKKTGADDKNRQYFNQQTCSFTVFAHEQRLLWSHCSGTHSLGLGETLMFFVISVKFNAGSYKRSEK